MFKQCRVLNKNINENFYGEVDTALENVDGYDLVEIPDDGNIYEWKGNKAVIDTEKDKEAKKEKKNRPILIELSEIDTKSIRPLRSILTAIGKGDEPSQEDVNYLIKFEEDAIKERNKLEK